MKTALFQTVADRDVQVVAGNSPLVAAVGWSTNEVLTTIYLVLSIAFILWKWNKAREKH